MLICNILLVLGAITLALYLMEKVRRYSVKAVLLKSTVSVLFIAVAVWGFYAAAARAGVQPLGGFVILGLVFGLLGDIWLDLKYVFPEQDSVFTYAGFTVFGIGHILYIAGLLLQFCPQGRPLYVLVPILLAALLSAGNALLEKPMKLRYGKMKPVVLAYGLLLFSTVLVTGSLAVLYGWRERTLNLFFVGGLLFALSDLILSGTYFGEGRERPVDLISNYLSYYAGQFLIACSLLFLG